VDVEALVENLLADASDPETFANRQAEAREALPDQCDGTVWPHDGCAIMLSVLLRHAGLDDLPYTCMALDLARLLQLRGWNVIALGDEPAGDVGTTCGDDYNPGVDHIYLVVKVGDDGQLTVADNQSAHPHPRPVAGNGDNYSPTTYFLRP